MRLSLLISVILAASFVSSYAVAGPVHLQPDRGAASRLSLEDIEGIIQIYAVGYNADGSAVLKGRGEGGFCTLTKNFDLRAQRSDPDPSLKDSSDVYSIKFADRDYCWISDVHQDDAQRVLNALKGWQMATMEDRQAWAGKEAPRISALVQRKAAEKVTEFKEVVAKYHAENPKPVISEDVHRYEVMAKANVRAKHFAEAENEYEEALEIAPWWPEGHFNASLILGEMRRYPEAIEHMRKYLELVPNAPDAREAKDRIYVWESGNN